MTERRQGNDENTDRPASRPVPPTPPAKRRLYFGDVSDPRGIAEALHALRDQSLAEQGAYERAVEQYQRDLEAYERSLRERPDEDRQP